MAVIWVTACLTKVQPWSAAVTVALASAAICWAAAETFSVESATFCISSDISWLSLASWSAPLANWLMVSAIWVVANPTSWEAEASSSEEAETSSATSTTEPTKSRKLVTALLIAVAIRPISS